MDLPKELLWLVDEYVGRDYHQSVRIPHSRRDYKSRVVHNDVYVGTGTWERCVEGGPNVMLTTPLQYTDILSISSQKRIIQLWFGNQKAYDLRDREFIPVPLDRDSFYFFYGNDMLRVQQNGDVLFGESRLMNIGWVSMSELWRVEMDVDYLVVEKGMLHIYDKTGKGLRVLESGRNKRSFVIMDSKIWFITQDGEELHMYDPKTDLLRSVYKAHHILTSVCAHASSGHLLLNGSELLQVCGTELHFIATIRKKDHMNSHFLHDGRLAIVHRDHVLIYG